MGCSYSSAKLRNLWDDMSPEGGAEAMDEVSEAESEWRLWDWTRLGGDELEQPLREGWVKLVRASWLVKLAERGGVLRCRQDLPQKAFVELDELKAAGPLDDPSNGIAWLRIIVISYPWLQPGHPDPYGENLRVIAEGLKLFVEKAEKDWVMNAIDPGCKPYGVLMDFTALFQGERTEEEEKVFQLALPALSLFFSHPHTLLFKVTEFPALYPNHPLARYTLPRGANTLPYAERGWCFAESAMSALVKEPYRVLDLSRLGGRNVDSFKLMLCCQAGHAPPLDPDDFTRELDKKTFTDKSADFEKVAKLYADAFERHLARAQELNYCGLWWGPGEVRMLLRGLRSNTCIKKLYLGSNHMGPEAVVALGDALKSNTSLQTLDLMKNSLGSDGAEAMGWALKNSASLRTLHLSCNKIGSGGAVALAEALQSNTSLQTLDLKENNVGIEGAAALGQALLSNSTLRCLSLENNDIGSAGAAALGEALRSNSTLRTLNLDGGNLGSAGAAVLAEALRSNKSLQKLWLRHNDIGPEGMVPLLQAMRSNRTLRRLNLRNNPIGEDCAAALVAACPHHLQVYSDYQAAPGSDSHGRLEAKGAHRPMGLLTNGIGLQGAATSGGASSREAPASPGKVPRAAHAAIWQILEEEWTV